MAQLTWQEKIARIEQAPKDMQTMVAKAFLRDDIDDEDVQYLFNTESPEEMNDSDVAIENLGAETPEGIGAMGFTMRTSRPSGNLNYMTTGAGGWNTCIKGSPNDPNANALANCVGYASGRFNEIINDCRDTQGCTYKTLNCNAANFDYRAENAGLTTGSEPKVGAIICWGGGSQGCGHVGVVEKVNPDGSIYTSESGYGCSAIFWNSTRNNSNGRYGMNSNYYFKCFIYQPEDVQKWIDGDQPTPTPISEYYRVNSPSGLWLLNDSKAKIDCYSNGTEVKFLNDGYDAYGYHYYHVQVVKDGVIGYMAKEYLVAIEAPTPVQPEPTPSPVTPEPTPAHIEDTLQVGDTVEIIGTGNGSCYGGCGTAYGIGWARQILKIWEGRPYPYQVGNNTGTTGFYAKDALKKK